MNDENAGTLQPSYPTALPNQGYWKPPSIRNPRSTGGAGVIFQDNVGVLCLLDLLLGSPSFVPPLHGRVVEVGFQQRYKDLLLDDIVVTYEKQNERIVMPIQATIALDYTAGTQKWREIICSAWHMQVCGTASPTLFGFATDSDPRNVAEVLLTAKNALDGSDLEEKILAAGAHNQTFRDAYQSIKTIIENYNPNVVPSKDELRRFLSRMEAMHFLVAGAMPTHRNLAIHLIRSEWRLNQEQSEAAFFHLLTLAQEGARTNGAYSAEQAYAWLSQRTTLFESYLQVAEPAPISTVVTRTLALHIEQLESIIVSEANDELERARMAFRKGDLETARRTYDRYRETTRWNSLDAPTRVRTLLLGFRLAVGNDQDVEHGRELLAEARSYGVMTKDVQKFSVWMASIEGGPEAALEMLGIVETGEQGQQRAGILLTLGRFDEAIAQLDASIVPQDVETERLRAYALLACNKQDEAFEVISRGSKLEPENEALLEASAIVHFHAAVAKGAGPFGGRPIPKAFIRVDKEAITHLHESQRILARLRRPSLHPRQRIACDVWRLACCIALSQYDAAQEVLDEILKVDSLNIQAIGWADLYDLSFDRDATIEGLKQSATGENLDLDALHLLSSLLIDSGKANDAVRILEKLASHVNDGGRAYYRAILSLARVEAGEDHDIDNPLAQQLLFMRKAQASGDWHASVEQLEQTYRERKDAGTLLSLVAALARTKDWKRSMDLLDDLLHVGSLEAIRLALQAVCNAQEFTTFDRLMREHEKVFVPEGLPRELRYAHARALERLGELDAAAAKFEASLGEGDSRLSMLPLARIYAMQGNEPRLRRTVERMLRSTAASPDDIAIVAMQLTTSAQDLAAKAWRLAAEKVSDDLVGATLSLGYHLGLDAHPSMAVLTERMMHLGREHRGGIEVVPVEQLPERLAAMKESAHDARDTYLRGNLPIHFFSESSNLELSDIWWAAFRPEDSQSLSRIDMMLRHSSRAWGQAPALNADGVRGIGLDITAILTLQHLNMLDAVFDSYDIRIPTDAILVLREMRRKTRETQRIEWLNSLIELLQTALDDRYHVLGSSTFHPPDTPIAIMPFFTLMQAAQTDIDTIVCDDRFISSYAGAGRGVPLVNSIDLLHALNERRPDLLDREKLQNAVATLQEARAFFNIVTHTEIVEALQSCRLNERGRVVETKALAAMRRYVSQVIERRDLLHRPDPDASGRFPFGEMPLLSLQSREIVEAIEHLWRDESLSKRQKIAYSDWVLESLYYDDLPQVHVIRLLQPQRSDAEILGYSFVGLLTPAFTMYDRRNVMRDYIRYINSHVFRSRLKDDPEVAKTFATCMRQMCLAALEGENDRNEALRLFYPVILSLPEPMQHALANDEQLADIFGIQHVRACKVGDMTFESPKIWGVVAEAIVTGKAQETVSLNPPVKVVITQEPQGVSFKAPSLHRAVTITDPVLDAIEADPEARRALLTQHPGKSRYSKTSIGMLAK